MICLIASTRLWAKRFAQSQHLRDDEWFHPEIAEDIMRRKDFHTILVIDGVEHATNEYINLMLELAWKYGRRK